MTTTTNSSQTAQEVTGEESADAATPTNATFAEANSPEPTPNSNPKTDAAPAERRLSEQSANENLVVTSPTSPAFKSEEVDSSAESTKEELRPASPVPVPITPPASESMPPPALPSREGALSPPPPRGENLARKASNGFGALLGRMGSIRKPARSPSAPRSVTSGLERRNTAASLASMASMDGSVMGMNDGMKPSLQDQFSSLRRQGEFGTHDTSHPQASPEHESIGPSGEVLPGSPRKTDNEFRPSTASFNPKSPTTSPTLNLNLPPGTAAGMTAGPAAEPQEVNWDLWQQVVYEGPAAVARTSGDELTKSITAGIPPAIRGVVWQVLAESKNEELENVYRTLKARGTDADIRPASSRPPSTFDGNGTATPKESLTSDASSEESARSGVNSGRTSPPTTELHSKLMVEKQKREAAALQKLEKAIKRDLGTRTSYSKFTQSAGLQDGLFGVCKAYALFDEGVGYAQGINFIAMPLLFNMSEEEAFTLLVRLMAKYDLRSLFTADMAGLHLRLYQFERLLELYEPAVCCHLKRRHVSPQLYATQWFLTLFVYRFPLQLVLRIYDLIFSEGLNAILKFGVVLMQRNREALLAMDDMSQLTNFLKEKIFDVYIDKTPSASSILDSGFFGSVSGGADKELYRADEMVRDACSIKISDETLAQYTVEWDEQRVRDLETENLRLANAKLTAKVRALEEQVQQQDTEHVSMAQDLVKVKVENDSLQDSKEALEMQIAALTKVVDAQPAEVEERLKEEMDRIMQRNIEVQNENRALREEMDETEMELVNAKMAHAQVRTLCI